MIRNLLLFLAFFSYPTFILAQAYQYQDSLSCTTIQINNETDIISVLPELVNTLKAGDAITVYNELHSHFLSSFLAFLNREHNLLIKYYHETEHVDGPPQADTINNELNYFNIQSSVDGNRIMIPGYDEIPHPKHGWNSLKEHFIYPPICLQNKVVGEVDIYCHISTTGDIIGTRIIRSLHPLIDKAAERAVKQIKWVPARTRDTPVRVWVRVQFNILWSKYNKPVVGFRNLESRWQALFVDLHTESNCIWSSSFLREESVQIPYMSDECFKILFDHPEYIVSVQHILGYMGCNEYGLVIDGEHILFIR
ncbi:energy transducer TonB [bacterium]|nr:energy transducer TonB [bacterium]